MERQINAAKLENWERQQKSLWEDNFCGQEMFEWRGERDVLDAPPRVWSGSFPRPSPEHAS